MFWCRPEEFYPDRWLENNCAKPSVAMAQKDDDEDQ
jgi:hypothetical protein